MRKKKITAQLEHLQIDILAKCSKELYNISKYLCYETAGQRLKFIGELLTCINPLEHLEEEYQFICDIWATYTTQHNELMDEKFSNMEKEFTETLINKISRVIAGDKNEFY